MEAAEFLHVSMDTIFYWAMAQLIPAHQLRYDGQTAWRFKRSELAEWRKQNPDLASPKGQRKLATRKRKPSVTQKKRTFPPANASKERKIS
ncbi:helix-turn-helix domain-containing protein [Candidatus Korobacter versatilis]|uniref:helix-turn-helix domain-containing protein n=1 Tax=Candidatus Korobacter versatilis TaxID=658062 RepID=UPI001E344E87|nr:helix-turn-helix domain-containing protein [Candidatus Koribacter versatilis]